MSTVPTFRRLARDQKAAAMILLALSMTAVTGAAAVAVDLGSIHLAKRRLQGIADASVLAAAQGNIAQDATSNTRTMLMRSGASDVLITSAEPGRYDQSRAPDARFQTGAPSPDALRLSLSQDVPLYFGRILTGQPTTRITARATAARLDMAAFSLGASLAQLSGGLPNALLSALAGTQLGLTAMDSQSLAGFDVDLFGFSKALSVRAGSPNDNIATLFNRDIPVNTIIRAIGDTAGANGAGGILDGIAGKIAGGRTLRLSSLIDVGPGSGSALSDPHAPITIDALSLVRSTLDLSGSGPVVIDLGATIPGLTSARLTLLTDRSRAQSPWMTITSSRDVILRTARTRLLIEAGLASTLSGIASLRVPIFVELAESQARLSDIRCQGTPSSDGVILSVTPSIGTVAIADVSPATLGDLQASPSLTPAVLANVVGTKITADAQISLGGTQPQSVRFSRSEIDAGTTKTVWTPDAVQGLALSLIQKAKIDVWLLGIRVPLSPLVSGVGQLLGVAAPALDELLNAVMALLGLHLGGADVQVQKMRCGQPVLVG